MMARDERPALMVLASTYPRWSDDHEPGFVHELAKRLTSRFRVLALVPHAPGAQEREILDGVEIIRYRYAPEKWETLVNDGGIVANLQRQKWKFLLVPGFVLSQAWTAWRLLRLNRVHVVHAHWLLPQGLIAALLLGSAYGTPYVVTSHGADLYALRNRWLVAAKRFVLRRASAATVVSGAMREHLRTMGVSVERISIQPMGVDMTQRFTPGADAHRSGRDLLFVGRLVEKKGLGHLLDAMPAVLHRFPDARLSIAGFGPEESALKARVNEMGLESNVRFLGAVPQAELPALYRRSALFVAPFVRARSGDEEGLGLVLVEAIGCGCPILAGRVAALKEVLGSDFDAMTCDPLDACELSERIVAALADPATARMRAAQLRVGVRKKFDWDVVGERYASLLGSVSRGARA